MPKLVDTTLREGGQSAGVYLSLAMQKKIIADLVAAGLDEIELGAAAAMENGSDLDRLCAFARSRFPDQAFSLWARCRPEDVRRAAATGVKRLSLSIPVSDLLLQKKMGKNLAWASIEIQKCVELAFALGVREVSLGLEDASRAQPESIAAVAAAARQAGVFRIRLADTVGVAEPAALMQMIAALLDCGMEIGVHCHNDYGMATANSIAALSAGAQWADATILGLGERAGNCRLEEVAAYLVMQKHLEKFDLPILLSLARNLASELRETLDSRRPLLGKSLFVCESGIHQHGLQIDAATYSPFAPETVGQQWLLPVGASCGRHGLIANLNRLGVALPDKQGLKRLWDQVRSRAAHQGRPLDDRELLQLLDA